MTNTNPFETIDSRLSNIEKILLDFKNKPHEAVIQPEKDELLTVQQAATYLSLSVATIYDKIHKRELPTQKAIGSKRCYFSKLELIEYLKQGRRKTNYEIAKEADEYLKKQKRVTL
jgi:excisionase family DNA binding protein